MSDEENIFQRYMDDVAKYELLSVEKEKELFKDMYKLTKSKGKVDFTINYLDIISYNRQLTNPLLNLFPISYLFYSP